MVQDFEVNGATLSRNLQTMQMIHGPHPQIASTHPRQASASQPPVVTIYKEVRILTDVIFLQLAFIMLDLMQDARERSILIEI